MRPPEAASNLILGEIAKTAADIQDPKGEQEHRQAHSMSLPEIDLRRLSDSDKQEVQESLGTDDSRATDPQRSQRPSRLPRTLGQTLPLATAVI